MNAAIFQYLIIIEHFDMVYATYDSYTRYIWLSGIDFYRGICCHHS
jgi:hypothetical protein